MTDAVLAVVLAGGLGTRMRPLTDRRPKPSLLVAGVPLIGRQLRWLAAAGVTESVLATGYRSAQLRDVVAADDCFDSRVSFVQEPEPLGTGGALALVCRSMAPDQIVVVVNGDQLTHHDLHAQLQHFRSSAALVSIHARSVDDARPFGLLEVSDSRVVSFEEKPREPLPGWVNSGTYVLRAGLLHDLPPELFISLEREVFPAVIAAGHLVVAYQENAYSLDVGSPSALLQASLDVVAATGQTCRLDGLVADPSLVSGHSWIGAGAVVGAGSSVSGSVVMPGAVIEDDVLVVDSVVAQGAVLKSGIRLQDNVIGEDAVVHRSLEPGEIVETGAVFR